MRDKQIFVTTSNLKLLNDEFSGRIVGEVVTLEHLAVEERLQILYGDLSGFLHKILLIDLHHFLLCSVSKRRSK